MQYREGGNGWRLLVVHSPLQQPCTDWTDVRNTRTDGQTGRESLHMWYFINRTIDARGYSKWRPIWAVRHKASYCRLLLCGGHKEVLVAAERYDTKYWDVHTVGEKKEMYWAISMSRFWVIMTVTICVSVSRVKAQHSMAVLPTPGANIILCLWSRRLLTYCMVQSPSRAANWFAASQEIPRISRNPNVHYRTHKRTPPVSILGLSNPVQMPKATACRKHPIV